MAIQRFLIFFGFLFLGISLSVFGVENSCSDAVFLRRVTIATTGQLPQPDKVKLFLESTAPTKRQLLVDELLTSEAHANYLCVRWGDILRIKSEFPSNLWPNGVQAYNRWVLGHIVNNTPYNVFVRELLVSKGSNFRMPAVNFYRAFPAKTPANFSKNIQLIFLGNRTTDTSGEVFFSQLKFKNTKEWKEEIVYVDYEKDGLTQSANLPDRTSVFLSPGTDWRETYVNWLTSTNNRRFAEVMVNRLWTWVMGKGLVNEPDDWGSHNPPVNPILLNKLTDEFIASGYDVRKMIKTIVLSAEFQSDTFESQRLLAEVLVDALADVTGLSDSYRSRVPEPFTFYPEGTRSVDLGDATVSSSALELFGRSSRDVSLESQHTNKLTDRQVLYLLNSSELEQKIRKSPKLKQICESTKTISELCNAVSCLTVGRLVTDSELKLFTSYAEKNKLNRRDFASDLLWMYVNSSEFLYQH
jgi:hypothetical protein